MESLESLSPITITDSKNGKVYTLEYCRKAIALAQKQGFKVDEVSDYPATLLPELFYLAFLSHHREMSKAQTDALLERLGKIPASFVERLVALYMKANYANVTDGEGAFEGNAELAVTM